MLAENRANRDLNSEPLLAPSSSIDDNSTMSSSIRFAGEEHDRPLVKKRRFSSMSGSFLRFEDISLSIPNANPDKSDKHILSGVSGTIYPGELFGIIGASGGGKTTLLSILSGRLYSQGGYGRTVAVSGLVHLNDTTCSADFPADLESLRRASAFVLQEDLLMEHETVEEVIQLSALLRLPNAMPYQEKLDRADEVIEDLDLEKCRTTKIGGKMTRGISGGEKKRTSIGVELVTDPDVIFLDEPTSGLDSVIAFETVSKLKELAEHGKTVVATIHQPSSETFNLIDRLMILAAGRVVYCGPTKVLVDYLAKLNYQCPMYTNVADYALQVISQGPDEFAENWYKHTETEKLRGDMTSEIERAKLAGRGPAIISEMAPLCTQLGLLFRREFRLFIRDPMPTYVRLFQTIFTALLLGLLWLDVKKNPSGTNEVEKEANIQRNLFGGIFFAVTFAVMNSVMATTLTFPAARLVFQKERSSRWYYTTPWIIANTCIKIPQGWIAVIVFVPIAKYMVGFNASLLDIFITLGLCSAVADGMGYLVGCIADRIEVAMQITPMSIIPLMLFSGFFVQVDQIPEAIRWLKYIDTFYYGVDAWSRSENLSLIIAADSVKMYEDWYIMLALVVGFRFVAMVFLWMKNGI